MAYRIDFTESNYVARSRRKTFLRLLLLATVVGAAYGVHYVYVTYNMPTLNMKLANYEAVARPIDEMDAAWSRAEKEYAAMSRYYRLVWADSPAGFLKAMSSVDAPRLGKGFIPRSWTLRTGGKCLLNYVYAFRPGDKAEQARGIETEAVNAVTSSVAVVDGKVEVQGVKFENLLKVDSLDISVGFLLPDVRMFPAKERTLTECVKEIALMRKQVQETKISNGKGAMPALTAQAIMMAYLAKEKNKSDFPEYNDVLNVSGWFERADQFIMKNNISGSDSKRRQLKQEWNKAGDARFPWHRCRALDNDRLVERTKALSAISDGVRHFKGFLEKRHADCLRKLEPFVEAYEHNDVFNKPFIETDLRDRVAKAAGISRASVLFKDEPNADPAILEKEDETFTFTWVRWTLLIGDAAINSDERDTGNSERIALERVADCAKRAVDLGPGYALDMVKVDFDSAGNVVAAVLDGLLPVKKVEPRRKSESDKESNGNVD